MKIELSQKEVGNILTEWAKQNFKTEGKEISVNSDGYRGCDIRIYAPEEKKESE